MTAIDQPVEIVNGLVHGVAPDTILAEFDWIDRPPRRKPSPHCLTPVPLRSPRTRSTSRTLCERGVDI